MKKAEAKDRIKEAMEIREIKQAELVEKTGIDKGQMSSYLSGKYKPKQGNLERIAKALFVDEAWLMGYDVPMERNGSKIVKAEEPPKIMQYYEMLNDIGKKTATEQVRLLTLDNKYTCPADVLYIKEPIPEYDIVAAHGESKTTDEQLEKMENDTTRVINMAKEKREIQK